MSRSVVRVVCETHSDLRSDSGALCQGQSTGGRRIPIHMRILHMNEPRSELSRSSLEDWKETGPGLRAVSSAHHRALCTSVECCIPKGGRIHTKNKWRHCKRSGSRNGYCKQRRSAQASLLVQGIRRCHTRRSDPITVSLRGCACFGLASGRSDGWTSV